MKTRIYLVATVMITLALACSAAGQAPVLFDGTNPVALSFQSAPGDDSIPRSAFILPADLAKELQSGKQKPLVIEVGPRTLYTQAHIVGSEYIGQTSSDEAKQKLRDRVKSLPKNTAIVLYCGCCPWSHCPNVHPAYQLLTSLGFSKVKVLYVADNFGTDWVSKGYPVAKGE